MNTTPDLEDLLHSGARAAGSPPPVAEAADGDGLVDVAVATMESPLGPLLLAATARGLVRVTYLRGTSEEEVLAEVARQTSPRILRVPARLDEARRQLDEYFSGRRRRFDLAVDLGGVAPFTRRVLDAATAIPFGRLKTYTEVAADAGSPRGARAAGNALGSNPVPIVVPCHRVVRTGGALGGYTGGLDIKRRLLEIERVTAA